MTQEDIDFLKELQHELNTQTTDGNADPVYWGVMESKMVRVPEDYGGDEYISTSEEYYTLEDYVDYLDECVSEDDEYYDAWKELDKLDIDDVIEFSNDVMGFGCYKIWLESQDILSHNTGAFLTKRSARKYIKHFGYNHSNPRTYAMTAYRNFELERLLKILKTADFDNIPITKSN